MKVILSPTCKFLSGSLGGGFGYFIVRRKNGFFGVRSRHNVPPDGHWRFIRTCAELAKMKLHISDIEVTYKELKEAIVEAKIPGLYLYLLKDVYDADDILTIKSKCGL